MFSRSSSRCFMAGFMLLTFALCTCAAAGGRQIRSAREPVFVDIGVGLTVEAVDDASPQHEALWAGMVRRVDDVVRQHPGRLIALRLAGLELAYERLSAPAQEAISRLSIGDPAAWYEQTLAAKLMDVIAPARRGGSALLAVVGLPFESTGRAGGSAAQVNAHYAPLIAQLDAFIASRSFILSSRTGLMSTIRRALPQALALAGPRPVLFRANRHWYAAVEVPGGGAESSPAPPSRRGDDAIAYWASPPNEYALGSSRNIALEMRGTTVQDPNVVFQVWSGASHSIEAMFADDAPPFVYPGAALDLVSPGGGEIQALVRDADNHVVEVISHGVTFIESSYSPGTLGDLLTGPTGSDDGAEAVVGDGDGEAQIGGSGAGAGADGRAEVGDGRGGQYEQNPPPAEPGASDPMPVIHLLSSAGMAPFAVHAHAMDSMLGAGDPLTALYEWDFGDPGGDYNALVGFNAAHVYEEPGQYTIALRITNEQGRQAQATAMITVTADTRARLYVAKSGDDAHDGGSPMTAVRTYARAMQLLDDDMTVLFRRGDRFEIDSSTPSVTRHNWTFGAYDTGRQPVLCWVGGLGYGAILQMSEDHCRDVLIEDLHLTSCYPDYPNRDICTTFFVGGENITVRRCTFGHVTDALNCNRRPRGVLSYDNIATGLHAYYLWGQGEDHTHVGNIVRGSTHEHNIRFGGIHRVLIARNDLTNSPKRCLWSMLGDYAYITGNRLHNGRLTVGPDHADEGGSPSDRFRFCVVENNIIDKTGFPETAAVEVEHGAEHVIIRSNVITIAGNSIIAVRGYSETKLRTTVDLRVFNNTGICPGTAGRFIRCGSGTQSLRIANNLYIAPELITGDNQSDIVFILDEDLGNFVGIDHNVWPIPAGCDWCEDPYHYLWPYWAHPDGCKNIAEWDAYDKTFAEVYDNIKLDEDYRPSLGSIAVGHAVRVPGVFTDLTGAERPADGKWTAGAVEVPR